MFGLPLFRLDKNISQYCDCLAGTSVYINNNKELPPTSLKTKIHVNCRRSYIYAANIDQATERIPLNTDIVVKGLGEFILSAFTTINQNSMKTILQYSLIVCSYQHSYMSIVLPAGQYSS